MKTVKTALLWIFALTVILAVTAAVSADSTGTCGRNISYTIEGDTITFVPFDSESLWRTDCRDVIIDNADTVTKAVLKENNGVKIRPGSGAYMFYECEKLTDLDLSGLDTSQITNMVFMFNGCSALKSLDLSGFDTSNVTNMALMFAFCYSLTDLNISNFKTSNVEYMQSMFAYCTSLTELNVSSFDTSNVINMSSMFSNCRALTNLDISNFNTAKVTDMGGMFNSCHALTDIKWSENIDTSSVTDMSDMFAWCIKLENLDVSNFDTANVTNMSGMFNNCRSLDSMDISNFVTSKVTDMSNMFAWCQSLFSLDLSNFDTSNVTDMSYMFNNADSLIELDISSWDTNDEINTEGMFNRTDSINTIILGSETLNKELLTSPQSMIADKTWTYMEYGADASKSNPLYTKLTSSELESADGADIAGTWTIKVPTITVTGKILSGDEYVYTGEAITIPSDSLYDLSSEDVEDPTTVTYSGDEVSVTDAGTHDFDLDITKFVYTGDEYDYVEFILASDGNVTISPAELTITANAQTYTYNGSAQGEDGSTTYTDTTVISAKVNSDGLKGSDALTGIKLNGTQTNVGTYEDAITPSAAVITRDGSDKSANYTVTYAPGTLTIEKADQDAPNAPTAASTSSTSITLTATDGYEYSMDGENWQDSPTFTGLEPETEYTFYQRIAEDDNHNPSPASEAAKISTTSHVHTWTYTAEGTTLTATCGNEDGLHNGDNPVTVTISAPLHTTYGDGKDPNAVITGAIDGVDLPDVVYRNGDTVLDAAPVDAGTYTASLTIDGATISVEYTIAKGTVPDDYFTPPTGKDGLVFNGSEQELINPGESDKGTFEYSTDGETWSNEIPVGKDPGTYTIYYRFTPEDPNYEPVVGGPITVVIAVKDLTVTVSFTDDSTVYNGQEQSVTPAFTISSDDPRYPQSAVSFNETVSGTDAGEYTYDFNPDDFANTDPAYNVTFTAGEKSTFILTIEAKPLSDPTVQMILNPEKVTYDGNEHTVTVAVYDTALGKTLTEGVDYEIDENDSILTATEIGIYNVTITADDKEVAAKTVTGTNYRDFVTNQWEITSPLPTMTLYPLSGFPQMCPTCSLPATGFSTRVKTPLSVQPENLRYQDLQMNIQIPALNASADLVTVPVVDNSWAVEWLGSRAGVLSGSSVPGEGYSVIAAHNTLNDTEYGPFARLSEAKINDTVFVTNRFREMLPYRVYANELMEPDSMTEIAAIAESEPGSLVLITCEDETTDGSYLNRRVVFAKPVGK